MADTAPPDAGWRGADPSRGAGGCGPLEELVERVVRRVGEGGRHGPGELEFEGFLFPVPGGEAGTMDVAELWAGEDHVAGSWLRAEAAQLYRLWRSL